MKKLLVFPFLLLLLPSCDMLNQLAQNGAAGLSTTDIINGLKEALTQGTNKGTSVLAARDGFFRNAAVKILLPPEAQQVTGKLSEIGMGGLVDAAVEKMNRAAEDAAKSAAPIFVDAIKKMTINDAKNILMGNDNAATEYLRRTTSTNLYNAFQPTIKSSLGKVGAIDAWNKVFSTYNKIPFVQQVNPNLDDHVTKKAIDGVFFMIAKEEKSIRKDPVQRTTALLKKVFAEQDRK
jgi:hypothetical protein